MKQLRTLCLPVLFSLVTCFHLRAQEIIRSEGRYLLLSRDKEVISPAFDSILTMGSNYERHYCFRSQGKWGIVRNADIPDFDWNTFRPKYDTIFASGSQNENMTYIVAIDGKFGTLSRSLQPTVPVIYDEIFVPKYERITAIRKGNKLALITPTEQQVFADQSFRFVYDELVDSGVAGLMSFRAGSKYGFCYHHKHETYLTEAIYDAPAERYKCFLKTRNGDQCFYFYSYEYSHNYDTVFIDLEVGENVSFVSLENFQSISMSGRLRTEKCYFHYPNLLVGIDHTEQILTFDLETVKQLDLFPIGGSYTFETLYKAESAFTLIHDYEPVCFVKSRVFADKGETSVTESYTELLGMNKIVEADLPFGYTLVLEKYELNRDYLCVRQQDQYGKMNRYKGYFRWNTPYPSYSTTKPDRDYEHLRSFSLGGGGSVSKDWMRIFWMGGR